MILHLVILQYLEERMAEINVGRSGLKSNEVRSVFEPYPGICALCEIRFKVRKRNPTRPLSEIQNIIITESINKNKHLLVTVIITTPNYSNLVVDFKDKYSTHTCGIGAYSHPRSRAQYNRNSIPIHKCQLSSPCQL